MYDVVIIGAGVVGCATAMELSKYDLKTLVLEKGEDVCSGTSKANSGLVHAGFDAKPGTLKAQMNVVGNEMMDELCANLDVPFKRTGALVAATNSEEVEILHKLYEQGIQNEVKELEILDREKAHKLEPNLSENVCAVLHAKTAGIICPFTLTIAMAENANVNGVDFLFEEEVVSVKKCKDSYMIETKLNSGEVKTYETKCIVNCAGVYSDIIHNMVSEYKYHITPRRGQYCLLDKSADGLVDRTIFGVPGIHGKGVLVTPTVHGNYLLGPTAEDVDSKEAVNTTADGLQSVLQKSALTVSNIPIKQIITSFSGLRAHEENGDFIINEAKDAQGFFDAVGIDSPGLSSAPAIGRVLADLVTHYLQVLANPNYIEYRKGITHFLSLPEEEQKKLLRVRPEYGTIVCRCELITEGEILDAIYRPLGARSLDAIKRRTRAGFGRCQAGFCSPRILELLSESFKKNRTEITKSGFGSELLIGENKLL